MKVNDEGIVLRITKYKNSSLIGLVFSKNHGAISLSLRGGSSKRNQAKAIVFQSPNIVNFECTIRADRDIFFLYDITPNIFYQSIPIDIKKAGISSFVTEVMMKICSQNIDIQLYMYLKSALLHLDSADVNISYFPLIFLKELSKILGIFPQLHKDMDSLIFDMLEGDLIEEEPHHHRVLRGNQKKVFISFMIDDGYELSSIEKKLVFNTLLDYYAIHIPNFGKLKSPGILGMIF